MNQTPWKKLPNIDKNCFACGPDNSHGLQMTFETDGQKLRSRITVPDHLRGWNQIVHGGVLSTICDEIMAWAAIYMTRRFILTRSITTTFLKPVFIGSRLQAFGFVKERLDDRNALMAGEIYDEKDDLCSTCTGEFVLFTPEAFRRMNLLPEELLDRMTGMFRKP